MVSKEFPFSVLEAIDGVGKSTITKLLGSELGAIIYASPPEPFRSFRRYFNGADPRLRFLFYLSANIYAGEMVKRWVKDQPVIGDRYLLSTLSAHEARGVPKRWFLLLNPIIKRAFPPDHTFLLDCEEDERLRRLKQRGLDEVDRENLGLGLGQKLFEGYQRWAEQLGYKIVKVDTTHLSPEEVKDEIASVILLDYPPK